MKKGVVLIFLCIYGWSQIATSSDEGTYQDIHVNGTTDNITEIQLAYTYAPVLWFYKNFLWEEPFTLIEAEYFIDVSTEDSSSNLKLRENGYSGAKILQSQYSGVKNPVYVRVTTDEYNGDTYLVIQYWFHYLYNYGGILSLLNFNHEGEWEMIEVVIKDTESVLNGGYPEPYLVAYSRHKSGEAHHWEDTVVEKEKEYHPVAYIAYGTHAAYFQDLGWNEDLTKGISVTCDDMEFIVLDTKEWLHFRGRWGGQENSPYGPQYQEPKWATPVLWALTHLDTYQLHLEHPGHLLITNAQGERIGFVGEQFVNEIDDAYAVITDEYEYYHLPDGDYSVEISAEKIGFDVVVNDSGEVTHMIYRHDFVEHIATVYTDLHADVKEYALQLDKNGDGKIDLRLEPEIMEYKKGYPFYWVVFVFGIIIVAFVSYKIQRKVIGLVRAKPREKTRIDTVRNVLEGGAAVFFLLWIVGVFGGIQYETELLLLAVALFLLSRVVSVINKGYSRAQKAQEVFITVGWGFSGLWIFLTVLQYSGWVDLVPAGIDRYFLVAGAALLLMGYAIKLVRIAKEHGFRILFVIGGVCIFSWVLTRIFFIFAYADYLLVAGIALVGIGIVGWLKRSHRKPLSQDST